MRNYELVMIISPSVADENISAIIDKTSQFITERGGSVAEVNQWGRKKLAYPIKRCMEGNYVLTPFKMDPNSAIDLQKNLRSSERILRCLLVKLGD